MGKHHIKHVVLLMLENRSFDQMLGGLEESIPDLDGALPQGARSNRDAAGRIYAQRETRELQMTSDPKHEHAHVMAQLEDQNGGFVRDFIAAHGDDARAACDVLMGYYPRGFLPALHTLGESFTVCDRWFASVPGPTWPNRMFALSGTSNGRVHMPEEITGLSMLWSQTQISLFDRLSEAGRSWRVYYYDFPVSLVLRRQRTAERLACYEVIDRFFAAASAPDAEASWPDFVLIEPQYFGAGQNDDHPPHNVMKGQKLIADVYNAIRSNDALWKSTLLVVVYDEHGGFYDHEPPPATIAPDAHLDEYTFDRLGVRVPAILISPWLERAVVHTEFDHTSILHYLIDKWGLGPLGARAARANDIGSAFVEERETPRDDTPSFIRVPNSALISPRPELEEQDASKHHAGLHLLADLLAVEEPAIEEVADRVAASALRAIIALPRFQAAIGDKLIALGRALRKPMDDAAKARIEKSVAAVDALRASSDDSALGR